MPAHWYQWSWWWRIAMSSSLSDDLLAWSNEMRVSESIASWFNTPNTWLMLSNEIPCRACSKQNWVCESKSLDEVSFLPIELGSSVKSFVVGGATPVSGACDASPASLSAASSTLRSSNNCSVLLCDGRLSSDLKNYIQQCTMKQPKTKGKFHGTYLINRGLPWYIQTNHG